MEQVTVEAAGGVVWRRIGDGFEVLVVHRPRHDDWSFPKGKLDNGESHRDAAVREVLEETGYACTLGPELPTVRYRDGAGRPKRVCYWAMEPASGGFTPNDEVDRIEWLAPDAVRDLLTYDHDRDVLTAAEAVLTPT